MTPENFVELSADAVFRSAISTTVETLMAPPGRRPPPNLSRAARWFEGLTHEDRATASWVIAEAAHAAAFGAFAVIDGVRQTGPDYYELVAVDADGGRTTVNQGARGLHEEFQSLVMTPEGALIVDATRS